MGKKMQSKEETSPLRFAILAVDVLLFTMYDNQLYVRVADVHRPPYFAHVDGFPGGLVHPNETTDESAERVLNEKGGIIGNSVYFEQLYTFSRVDRDPRGRVVSVAYLALAPREKFSPEELKGSDEVRFVSVSSLRSLAYDHDEVFGVALARLRSRVKYTSVIKKLIPKEFTLTELEQAYETVLGTPIDKRNFRKKFAKLDLLEELPRMRLGGKHRPAKLYKFCSSKVEEVEII